MSRTSAETRMYSALTGNAALVALVGARIYPVQAPQGTAFPMLIFRRITTNRHPCITGEVGMEQCRIQIDALAGTYDAVKAVAAAVLDALDAATSVRQFRTSPLGQVDEMDSDLFVDRPYRIILDFDVWNEE